MKDFKEKKFRFLCSCNMISEGWDYPELSILVMARPTISKVLYTQQLGRGLRRTSSKQEVYVIDVVDEYGSMVMPCSLHSIFKNQFYVPFGDITRTYRPGDYIEINGISEQIQTIMEIDIHSFEDKYEGYLSTEQLARECYVSTGTVNNWLQKKRIEASVTVPFGNKKLYMFSPETVQKIKIEMGCKEHNDQTIKDDFMEFVKEKDYTLSYKMPFMISFLSLMDTNGEAKIDEVLDQYIAFYQKRIEQGLIVDRSTCPYNEKTLADRTFIKKNMLTNPFEKYERKRFMYYSKDLGVIALNHVLAEQLDANERKQIIEIFNKDLKEYYRNIDM